MLRQITKTQNSRIAGKLLGQINHDRIKDGFEKRHLELEGHWIDNVCHCDGLQVTAWMGSMRKVGKSQVVFPSGIVASV